MKPRKKYLSMDFLYLKYRNYPSRQNLHGVRISIFVVAILFNLVLSFISNLIQMIVYVR